MNIKVGGQGRERQRGRAPLDGSMTPQPLSLSASQPLRAGLIGPIWFSYSSSGRP